MAKRSFLSIVSGDEMYNSKKKSLLDQEPKNPLLPSPGDQWKGGLPSPAASLPNYGDPAIASMNNRLNLLKNISTTTTRSSALLTGGGEKDGLPRGRTTTMTIFPTRTYVIDDDDDDDDDEEKEKEEKKKKQRGKETHRFKGLINACAIKMPSCGLQTISIVRLTETPSSSFENSNKVLNVLSHAMDRGQLYQKGIPFSQSAIDDFYDRVLWIGAEELYGLEEEDEEVKQSPRETSYNDWESLYKRLEEQYGPEVVWASRWLKKAYFDERCDSSSNNNNNSESYKNTEQGPKRVVRLDVFNGIPEDKSSVLFFPANASKNASTRTNALLLGDGSIRLVWYQNRRNMRETIRLHENMGTFLREERDRMVESLPVLISFAYIEPKSRYALLDRLAVLFDENKGKKCCWSLMDVSRRFSGGGGGCSLDVLSFWSYWVIYLLDLGEALVKEDRSLVATTFGKNTNRKREIEALGEWYRRTDKGKYELSTFVFDVIAKRLQRRFDLGAEKKNKKHEELEVAIIYLFQSLSVMDSEEDSRNRLNLAWDWCNPRTDMEYTCAFDSLIACFTFQSEYASFSTNVVGRRTTTTTTTTTRNNNNDPSFSDWRIKKRWGLEALEFKKGTCLFDRLSLFGGMRHLERVEDNPIVTKILNKGRKALDDCAEYASVLFCNAGLPSSTRPSPSPLPLEEKEEIVNVKESFHGSVLGCQPLSLLSKYRNNGGITMSAGFNAKRDDLKEILIALIDLASNGDEGSQRFGALFGLTDRCTDDSLIRIEQGCTLFQILYWKMLDCGRTVFDILQRYVRLNYVANAYKGRKVVGPEDLQIPPSCRSLSKEKMELWMKNSTAPAPSTTKVKGTVSWAYFKHLQEQYQMKHRKRIETEGHPKEGDESIDDNTFLETFYYYIQQEDQQSRLAHDNARFDVVGDPDTDRFHPALELCKSQFHYDFPKALCREKIVEGSLARAATFSWRSGATNPEELMGMSYPQRFLARRGGNRRILLGILFLARRTRFRIVEKTRGLSQRLRDPSNVTSG